MLLLLHQQLCCVERITEKVLMILRLGIDYHKLNVIKKHPQFQLINEILANIKCTNFMSEYFQIAVKTEDIAKTAFIMRNGCFTFKDEFYLFGASSTFQKAMNRILRLLIGKGILFYLNDMVATFEIAKGSFYLGM